MKALNRYYMRSVPVGRVHFYQVIDRRSGKVLAESHDIVYIKSYILKLPKERFQYDTIKA